MHQPIYSIFVLERLIMTCIISWKTVIKQLPSYLFGQVEHWKLVTGLVGISVTTLSSLERSDAPM